ncbi:MAG: Ribosomal RNA small subunit methyltransferase H [Candidatus Nomurabacteria bacterium GW2011_GWC2_41_8]|uniref:Ribosomal RNA small subunit methyltransferase H n=1 Tax=Candidatus Nomurabacteria bacterium GW2011_GWC2_41_8 TaxID=1618755 RepID=A0A0G0XEQ8_9BACT|nr:MAG: Ribosomal RNA small subunit methyltransferase H [Candidatus Nomurabacteria bacterium GW2011_GWC2_41_8]
MHKTVLLNETIDGLLAPQKAGNENLVIVDATFGGGGHSLEICKRCPSVKIIALDQDKSVFEKAKDKFKGCDIVFINKNFRDLDIKMDSVDGIIFDLGLSSDQLENSGRGFSFMKDEPLLMTMKEPARRSLGAGGNPSEYFVTADDVVNTWGEENLADIIYGYGEERYSRRIAKGIVDARHKRKIKSTFDLVQIIREAAPAGYRRGRIHFATRTFQALRIAVNDELGVLKTGLEKGFDALKTGGRMSVISFHSLEDRIVKKFFREKKDGGEAFLINKKPVLVSEEELKNNPRARSAKLRILEKI